MKINNVKGKRVYLLIILFAIFSVGVILYNKYNSEETYLVNEGVIEYTTNCVGYVVKKENVLDIDNSKILIPTISEGSRVSKNNIIATYRGAEYEEYQKKLQDIDNKILEEMKEIDIHNAIEVSNLENQVVAQISELEENTSMVEMQETKNKINDLLRKRASIIGELSPEEAYLKELISERDGLEAQIKTSSSNVTAPIGGIISYNVDGLEDKLTEESIMTLNYEDVKGYINNSEQNFTNKIKIINNYEAYIIVRTDNAYGEYIELEKEYKLKIRGTQFSELIGTVVKMTETEQGHEVVFRIRNGVENIIGSRECEIEVVWTVYEGLVVPTKAIKENKSGKNYVTILTRGDYVDIPVKVQRKNNTYAIVENFEKENINDYILERYDQVVMESK